MNCNKFDISWNSVFKNFCFQLGRGPEMGERAKSPPLWNIVAENTSIKARKIEDIILLNYHPFQNIGRPSFLTGPLNISPLLLLILCANIRAIQLSFKLWKSEIYKVKKNEICEKGKYEIYKKRRRKFIKKRTIKWMKQRNYDI